MSHVGAAAGVLGGAGAPQAHRVSTGHRVALGAERRNAGVARRCVAAERGCVLFEIRARRLERTGERDCGSEIFHRYDLQLLTLTY